MDEEKAKITDRVPESRWLRAQHWEKTHWERTQKTRARFAKNYIWKCLRFLRLVGPYRGDDWNRWWMRRFEDYEFLPASVENAIEVGCGPYTNIRLVWDRIRIKHLALSDPLIQSYIKYKFTFVREMFTQARCMLDDHPLEHCPFRDELFDLVMIINVLDHVQDASLCMDNVVRITRAGGILILGQDLTNEEDLNAVSQDPGLIGHPIKLGNEWFEPWLSHFEPILYKILPREEGREPLNHYGTLVFAGKKKTQLDQSVSSCINA